MSQSLSTVTNVAGVLPTPSSCANQAITFQSSSGQSGCTFTPQGSDLSPYQKCCGSSKIATFADGCGFFCSASSSDINSVSNCLSGIGNDNSVSCQSNGGGSGSGNSFNEIQGGNGGNDININGVSTTISAGSDSNSDSGSTNVVAATNAIAGPGETVVASTSVGPNGAAGTGTTIGGTGNILTASGAAQPTGFATASGAAAGTGAPFPNGNSTGNTFLGSGSPSGSPTNTAPLQSFTGAAASVQVPGAGMSKGGLFAVGLLVFSMVTGAML
ncbi:hypothetical protein NA57DRAFT_56086 [Rhizodiscina lignyota]|uniref:Uncharacterized protein n=1 Tax=Rhizodiscina lignyota TaxID=1504668 RepID=A0A9P4IKI3_9PEZI|nr:hypothetical protein NA57DRAFT_56086 [Rhizodiscina lignyota]